MPWFNIKMQSYQFREPHFGDKTVVRPSYLHNGISYTGKMASLLVLHINTTETTEIFVHRYSYRHFDILPIDIYISMSCFSGFAWTILQKNTANTLQRARMIIPILNIILSTLNPMVVFTYSPYFPILWESCHLPDESSLKIAQI